MVDDSDTPIPSAPSQNVVDGSFEGDFTAPQSP
jgi:hypothetical protein